MSDNKQAPTANIKLESLVRLLKQYKHQTKSIEHGIKQILTSKIIKQLDLPLSPNLLRNTPTVENIVTNLLTIYIIKIKLLSQFDLIEPKYLYIKLSNEIASSLTRIINQSSIIKQYEKILSITTSRSNNNKHGSCLKTLFVNYNQVLKSNIYSKVKDPSGFYNNLPNFKNRHGQYLSLPDRIVSLEDVYNFDLIKLDWYLQFYQLGGYDLELDTKKEYLIKYLKFRRLNYDDEGAGKYIVQ